MHISGSRYKKREEKKKRKEKNLSSESFSGALLTDDKITGKRISCLQTDNWTFHFGCNVSIARLLLETKKSFARFVTMVRFLLQDKEIGDY